MKTRNYILFTCVLFVSLLYVQTTYAQENTGAINVQYKEVGSVLESYHIFELNTTSLNQSFRNSTDNRLQLQFGNLINESILLEENEIRSASYKMHNGLQDFPKSPCMTYKGVDEQGQTTQSRITLTDSYFGGRIETSRGIFYIETIKEYKKEAPANQFVVYAAEDILPIDQPFCGNDALPPSMQKAKEQANNQTETTRSSNPTCIQLAVASDSISLENYNGNEADLEARILDIFSIVQTTYDDELNIDIDISELWIPTCTQIPCDPWPTGLSLNPLLSSFKAHAHEVFDLTYDIATLYTDRTQYQNYGGITEQGNACSGKPLNVINDWSPSIVNVATVWSHEIAHDLGAGHDVFGGSCSIMKPLIGSCGAPHFSPYSLDQINTYLPNKTCLGCGDESMPNVQMIEVINVGQTSAGYYEGTNFSAQYLIRNSATSSLPSVDVQFYLRDGNGTDFLMESFIVTSLSPDQHETYTVSLSIPTGIPTNVNYDLYVKADYSNTLTESNEIDNFLKKKNIYVQAPSPDLVPAEIAGISYVELEYFFSANNSYNGTTHIKNIGTVDANISTSYAIYLSTNVHVDPYDLVLATGTVPPIPAGGQSPSIPFTLQANDCFPNGFLYIILVADSNNNLQESSEPNNQLSYYTELYNAQGIPFGIDPTIFYVCEGELLQLEATGASSYQWSSNNNSSIINSTSATPYVFNSEQFTIYTAVGTQSNGCQFADQVTVHVHSAELFAFPNNNNSEVTFQAVLDPAPANMLNVYDWSITEVDGSSGNYTPVNNGFSSTNTYTGEYYTVDLPYPALYEVCMYTDWTETYTNICDDLLCIVYSHDPVIEECTIEEDFENLGIEFLTSGLNITASIQGNNLSDYNIDWTVLDALENSIYTANSQNSINLNAPQAGIFTFCVEVSDPAFDNCVLSYCRRVEVFGTACPMPELRYCEKFENNEINVHFNDGAEYKYYIEVYNNGPCCGGELGELIYHEHVSKAGIVTIPSQEAECFTWFIRVYCPETNQWSEPLMGCGDCSNLDSRISLKPSLALQLSPNPVNEWLNLEVFSPATEQVQVLLQSINGQTLHQESISLEAETYTNIKLDTHTFPNGLYILQLQSSKGSVYEKLIIQH